MPSPHKQHRQQQHSDVPAFMSGSSNCTDDAYEQPVPVRNVSPERQSQYSNTSQASGR